MTIGPIEESFALLNKYGLHYSSHDSERVDSLTYSWKKVNSQVFSLESSNVGFNFSPNVSCKPLLFFLH